MWVHWVAMLIFKHRIQDFDKNFLNFFNIRYLCSKIFPKNSFENISFLRFLMKTHDIGKQNPSKVLTQKTNFLSRHKL